MDKVDRLELMLVAQVVVQLKNDLDFVSNAVKGSTYDDDLILYHLLCLSAILSGFVFSDKEELFAKINEAKDLLLEIRSFVGCPSIGEARVEKAPELVTLLKEIISICQQY